ncbi:MAG: aminoglycoside 6-adenylyltransferase [Anaerolineae bacterium]|nr:aminoglycoside 6-adenylyltransferase [Anaerolineae bacterium]
MNNPYTWQTHALEQLSRHFAAEPDAKAFVLTGSLAAADTTPDFWSDVDVKIILDDQAIERYSTSPTWLQPFGQLVGVERHTGSFTKTLRVCLEGFKRFDLVFIPESALQSLTAGDKPLFHQPCTIVWSRLPGLEKHIAPSPPAITYENITSTTIANMADHFWFKAAVAITKVMRSDLLIGLHLALDLARDCLVLQMLRRDQALRTTIHRTGGWGNAWVEQLLWDSPEHSEVQILDLIARSCTSFDELAAMLSPGYTQRWPLLSPAIARAKSMLEKTRM